MQIPDAREYRLRTLRVNRTPPSSPSSQASSCSPSPLSAATSSPPTPLRHLALPHGQRCPWSRPFRLSTPRPTSRPSSPPSTTTTHNRISTRNTSLQPYLHSPQQISQPSPQPYLPILVTFHSCNTSMQPLCNPIPSHSCKRISVAMTLPQPKARSSPPPHPSSLPSSHVPSSLSPLPSSLYLHSSPSYTAPFSPLSHTSFNPHPPEFRPSAP